MHLLTSAAKGVQIELPYYGERAELKSIVTGMKRSFIPVAICKVGTSFQSAQRHLFCIDRETYLLLYSRIKVVFSRVNVEAEDEA